MTNVIDVLALAELVEPLYVLYEGPDVAVVAVAATAERMFARAFARALELAAELDALFSAEGFVVDVELFVPTVALTSIPVLVPPML